MFSRNTGKPLKGPTMGAHTIHKHWQIGGAEMVTPLSPIFFSFFHAVSEKVWLNRR